MPAPPPRNWLAAALAPVGHAVAYYPLVLPVPVLVYLLVWGKILADYDGFHMFWTDDPVVGVLNGFGVASILGGAVLGVFLLDQDEQTPGTAVLPTGTEATRDVPARDWAGYWVAWLLLLAVAAAPAVVAPLLDELDPFALNGIPDLQDASGNEIPLPPAAGAEPFEPDDHRRAAAGRMANCRWWFPIGLGVAAVVYAMAFGACLRWARGWWRNPERIGVWFLRVVLAGYLLMLAYHTLREKVFCPAFAAPVSVLLLLGFVEAVAVRVTALGYHLKDKNGWLFPVIFALAAVPLFVPAFQTEFLLPGMLDTDGADLYAANHRFKLADYDDWRRGRQKGIDAEKKLAALPDPVRELVPDEKALDAWHARILDRYGAPRPLVVVGVSGGASASALYTADVLFTLEHKHPGFADQVRVVSGASGGMLGAAYFVAVNRPGGELGKARQTYVNGLKAGDPKAEEAYRAVVAGVRKKALADLGQDFLGPIVQKWVHKDIPLSFLPTHHFARAGRANDRGRALELAWHDHLRGPDGAPLLDVPFVALREEERRGETPSLVFTPMLIEDGRQLVVSNLDLDYLVDTIVDRTVDPQERVARVGEPSHPSVEFFRMFPGATRFSLGTAVRMSASFPFFSPSAAIPTAPYRHLVDAGYYDNYGTFTATRWLMEQAGWLNANLGNGGGGAADFFPGWAGNEVVLLQVRCFAFEKETRAYVRHEERNGADPREVMLDLTAPPRGLLAVRRAQMIFRGDERVDATRELLARRDRLGPDEEPIRFRRALVECAVEPSLNWVLTADTRRRLRADVYHQVESKRAAEGPLRGFLELQDKTRRP